MIQVLSAVLLLHFPQDAGVASSFRTLHEKGDREGCAALWRERPSLALPTIEADLDAALAIREKGKEADLAAAESLERRALWGAAVAREALAAPLIADLAASRAGWSDEDRGFYRDELKVHGRAKETLGKEGQEKVALETAREALSRAMALGDWHGAAAAHETCAIARQALSSFEDSLLSWVEARRLYRELHLADAEIVSLRGALDMCFAAERSSRGRELADQAAELCRGRKDRKSEAEFLHRRAAFEDKLGLGAQARATREQAKLVEK